jgi:hypothetical protein
MGLDDDNLNIKAVPLGDVKLFTLKTLSLETISFSFYAVPKSDVNTCPLFFGKACMPKNNMHGICSKDDVNTPSAIYISQGDNYVSAMFVLRAIIIYWLLPT